MIKRKTVGRILKWETQKETLKNKQMPQRINNE